jgi:signal peptidase I
MKLRWFLSGKVRQATDMCNHVEKLLNAQRDILSPPAVEAVTAALSATKAAVVANVSDDLLDKQMARLEEAGTKWFKLYPHSELRENIEVFLVAIVVAMAIRTFFLQPFKIPTGSMEPTLYGIEVKDLRDAPGFTMPSPLARFWDLIIHGTIYHNIIAPADGEVVKVGRLTHIFGVINKQTILVQYEGQSQPTPIDIYFGPDDYFEHRTGLDRRSVFTKGEPILRFEEVTGDHLFVDRLTYNFRRPERGEIIVFKTAGIPGIPDPGQFYIKRLIGLPGESVSIGDDRHVRINGKRLDATTPHFANLYGFDPNERPMDGVSGKYSGHVLVPERGNLRTPDDTLAVPSGHFVAFGDNTVNSLDSRYWGPLPEDNVIGKSFFVYWPITDRFGWGYQR